MSTLCGRNLLPIVCLTLVALAGCDSDSSVVVGSAASGENTDFFDDHVSDRSEYAHYSAHDMDINRRDTGGFDNGLALGASLRDTFRNWESPHVYPLDLTPDSNTLLAVNTPDAKLEVFDMASGVPVSLNAIPAR